MAAAAATSTMLELTSKATNLSTEIASGWYKASEAMKSFPIKLSQLRLKSEMYASLLQKYGLEDDPYIEELLKKVIKLLDDEEIKLQQLQDRCCLGMGRKLLFPDSITIELDAVIAAYESLSKHMIERDTLAQQLEKASLNKPQKLPFEHDQQYVPIEKSVEKVRAALEQESSCRIVVISGGSGQGKSSMARYLAYLYQDGIQSMSPAERVAKPAALTNLNSPKTFKNGVFFLGCGTDVNTRSLLMQLWQDMGFQALPTSSSKKSDYDQSDLQEEEEMRKQLSSRLKNQRVLIILDDVQDPKMVDKLLLQGKWIKYLITTEVSRFRNDAIETEISKPSMSEARNIIANYVIGYPKKISHDIQMEIDGVIKKSDHNPLVLANVATTIRDGGATELDEWKLTQTYLADLQDGDVKRPASLYGNSYSKRTMGASMEMALNSFSSEEQTLVLLASMFESRPIPEVVFKILFKRRHSSLARFSKYSEHLVRANFIEIKSAETKWSTVPRRTWSIHNMRRISVRKIKEKEMALMFSEMCEELGPQNLVAMLCTLYGEEPGNDHTTSKTEVPTNLETNPPIPPIEPFVWLLEADPQEEYQLYSHQLAVEVLHKYLLSIENYDISLSCLLEKPQTFLGACEAFYTIHSLYYTSTTFQIHEMLENSLAILVQNLDLEKPRELYEAALVTIGIVSHHVVENTIKIGSFSSTVERLVALLQEGLSPQVQLSAAWALRNLSEVATENAVKIGSNPNAVERLVALLQEEVNFEVQEKAALTLGTISEFVVDNAIKIGSFPNALERLVALLQEAVRPGVQEKATWALGVLSKDVVYNATKIGSFPNAMERLVALLEEGVSPEVQEKALWTLGVLSKDVMDNAIKIGSFPNVVERLVALLQESMIPQIQSNAAWVLGVLSNDVVDNSIKIGSFPNAIERLVALLEEDISPEVQKTAAWALGALSNDDMDNAINIGSFSNATERLVALLKEGFSPEVQESAAWALGALSKIVVDNAIQVGSFPNALERLVALLKEGVSPKVQESAAWALGALANHVGDNAVKIRLMPNAVERLKALLQEGMSPTVQQSATWALEALSRKSGGQRHQN